MILLEFHQLKVIKDANTHVMDHGTHPVDTPWQFKVDTKNKGWENICISFISFQLWQFWGIYVKFRGGVPYMEIGSFPSILR